MSELVVEAADDIAGWPAVDATGAPSSALAVAEGAVPATSSTLPVGGDSLRVVAAADAADHRIERARAAMDLRPFDDLVLWLRGTGPAPNLPLELRIGSDARPPGHAQNRWYRRLPVDTGGRWQPVIVGLDGIATGVRSAVTRLRFTVREGPWTVEIGPVRAVRSELLSDLDAALLGRFAAAGLSAAVLPVPAADLPAPPFLRISPGSLRPSPARARDDRARTDFTDEGFVLREPPVPYDVDYSIDVTAEERAEEARLLESALDAVGTPPAVLAGGLPVRGEWLEPASEPGEGPHLRLRLAAWRRSPVRGTPAVPPFNEIDVGVDHGAA